MRLHNFDSKFDTEASEKEKEIQISRQNLNLFKNCAVMICITYFYECGWIDQIFDD